MVIQGVAIEVNFEVDNKMASHTSPSARNNGTASEEAHFNLTNIHIQLDLHSRRIANVHLSENLDIKSLKMIEGNPSGYTHQCQIFLKFENGKSRGH